MLASSREGGDAVVRVCMPRARSAAASVFFSLSSWDSLSVRAWDANERAAFRAWILERSLVKAELDGSTAKP